MGFLSHRHFTAAALTILVLCWPASAAPAGMNAPPGQERAAAPGTGSSPAGSMAGALVGVFQRFISPLDGDRCPSAPTCSAYARQAFARHGFLLGSFLTIDRLLHEADMADHAPLIRQGDRLRFHDPLENNEFWRSR